MYFFSGPSFFFAMLQRLHAFLEVNYDFGSKFARSNLFTQCEAAPSVLDPFHTVRHEQFPKIEKK